MNGPDVGDRADVWLGDLAQLGVGGGGVDDERREELLEHVSVLLQHQPEELGDVVRDEVDLVLLERTLFDPPRAAFSHSASVGNR